MEMQSIARPFLLLCFTLFLLSPCLSDPDPLQDFCVANLQTSDIAVDGFPCKRSSSIVSNDFFSTVLSKECNTDNIFSSNVIPADVLSFPGLKHTWALHEPNRLRPGRYQPLSLPPRATELGLVLQGQLLVGFVSTSNVFYSKIVNEGENFVIPRGLVHFQYNMGKEKALAITAFNSQLPGVVIAPVTLFGSNPAIPSEVLAKTFQVDQQVVNQIKSKFGN